MSEEKKIATITIKNLALSAILGIDDWERREKQDILVNIAIDFDATRASATDTIEDTVNYKTIKKRIISEVESSSYFLVEKLTDRILGIIMEDDKVLAATVKIDKPFALRFAESVAVQMSARRGG